MIGVCIRYFHENYGGMLQAFATVKFLEEHGLDYELIQYRKKKSISFLLRSVPRLFNRVLLNDKYEMMQKKMNLLLHPDFHKNDNLRNEAFRHFRIQNFTRLSSDYFGYHDLCRGAKKYTAVLSGSDQLWSPAGLPTNFYNLKFVPESVCKISYASSFGVSKIPFYQRTRTAEYLKRFQHISMRENKGSEIVCELTGRKVETVLDPVFLFDAEGWNKLLPIKIGYHEPYIFAYFLGGNPKHREAVKELALETGLKIVALRHMDQFVGEDETFGDYAPYDVGPGQFLDLLRGAEYVCTDSFHGSSFSIIFRKQFLVFNRYDEASKLSKNSRIDSLCRNLGLEDRRYSGNISVSMMKHIDYNSVDKKLQDLRKASQLYLKSAFDLNERSVSGGVYEYE